MDPIRRWLLENVVPWVVVGYDSTMAKVDRATEVRHFRLTFNEEFAEWKFEAEASGKAKLVVVQEEPVKGADGATLGS